MNIFILTDIEGISGVNSIKCIDKTTEEYALACRKLEESINFTARICRENGAEKIWYLDGHGGGGNVNPDNILLCAQKVGIAEWEEQIRSGKVDFQIELGCHARAGTIGGFLDHTMNSSRWFRYLINGKEYSELGIHAAFCGSYGVPVALCSGDEAACAQAREYVPNIVTAPVKTAAERDVCVDYPDADKILKNAIVKAIKEYRDISPLVLPAPVRIELTYYRTDMCEEDIKKCTCTYKRKDARTLTKTIDKITSYHDLKF